MILTDREIQAAIKGKQIIVDPVPGPDAYSSTSLDLTLSKDLKVWNPSPPAGVEQTICPGDPNYRFNDFVKSITTAVAMGNAGYIVQPQAFILAWTAEEIGLPPHARIAARVEGKSSLARLGIGIHITAPTIHAGFSGPIQLEICNHGPLKVKLTPGLPVCQLIFEQTFGTPDKGYSGQFLGQKR